MLTVESSTTSKIASDLGMLLNHMCSCPIKWDEIIQTLANKVFIQTPEQREQKCVKYIAKLVVNSIDRNASYRFACESFAKKYPDSLLPYAFIPCPENFKHDFPKRRKLMTFLQTIEKQQFAKLDKLYQTFDLLQKEQHLAPKHLNANLITNIDRFADSIRKAELCRISLDEAHVKQLVEFDEQEEQYRTNVLQSGPALLTVAATLFTPEKYEVVEPSSASSMRLMIGITAIVIAGVWHMVQRMTSDTLLEDRPTKKPMQFIQLSKHVHFALEPDSSGYVGRFASLASHTLGVLQFNLGGQFYVCQFNLKRMFKINPEEVRKLALALFTKVHDHSLPPHDCLEIIKLIKTAEIELGKGYKPLVGFIDEDLFFCFDRLEKLCERMLLADKNAESVYLDGMLKDFILV